MVNITPAEACIAIRVAAASANALIDDTATLDEIHFRSVERWLEERKEADDDWDEEEEVDRTVPPNPMALLASTAKPATLRRFSFTDYLLAWEEGMWLRWAFQRMERRLPQGKVLAPYLEAVEFLRERKRDYGEFVHRRWLEWSKARELTDDEAQHFSEIWNTFVPAYDHAVRDGKHWDTNGIDDHVDDVHVFVLTGDDTQKDPERVVFWQVDFQAVLVPETPITLYGKNGPVVLGGTKVKGFTCPTMPRDIWGKPILPWIKGAAGRQDAAIEKFLSNRQKRYPVPRPYDGPQACSRVWISLPRINASGNFF